MKIMLLLLPASMFLFGCASRDDDQVNYARAAIADTQHDVQCRRDGRGVSTEEYDRCMGFTR